MNKILLLTGLLAVQSASAAALVEVYRSGGEPELLQLNDAARLADLLTQPTLKNVDYWRNAQIATTQSHQQMLAAKQQLLKDLKQFQIYWMREHNGGMVQAIQQLLREVDQVQVTGRLPVLLDPDLALVRSEHNPRLEDDYQLYLAPRNPVLYITGLINGRNQAPLQGGNSLRDYWAENTLLFGADQNEGWLIQPTGVIERVPVAYWNQRHREPMPGATLFIGFDPDLLPPEYANLNQRIATLFANRMPQ